MCEAQCRGTIEFPGVGIGPRSSDEAANRMASEVRQSLRCSAESVLCLSKQPAHEVRVIELDEVARATRISVASSHRCRIAAGDCEQNFGWLLPSMTTKNMARDLDSIRAAFGVAKINYFAFSWGTYLGQVYATLFPQRVRRMVLDSTVDPTGVWYTDNVDQDYAFQGRMNAFYAWVSFYHLVRQWQPSYRRY